MKKQFSCSREKQERNVFRILFFSMFLLGFSVVQSQVIHTPVDEKFHGEWVFERAEAQERPMHSQQSHTKRSVSLDEFHREVYLLNVPTEIIFMENFRTVIGHPSWRKPAIALINDQNELEFRMLTEEKSALYDLDSYPAMYPSYTNMTLLGNNRMRIQSSYIYHKQGENIEGILTMYYSRR